MVTSITPQTLYGIRELNQDIDLLSRPDEWLDTQRSLITSQMAELAAELEPILKAQKLKRTLQQTNLVAVQNIDSSNGQIKSVYLDILPLNEAIGSLQATDHITSRNRCSQLENWRRDGYDINACISDIL